MADSSLAEVPEVRQYQASLKDLQDASIDHMWVRREPTKEELSLASKGSTGYSHTSTASRAKAQEVQDISRTRLACEAKLKASQTLLRQIPSHNGLNPLVMTALKLSFGFVGANIMAAGGLQISQISPMPSFLYPLSLLFITLVLSFSIDWCAEHVISKSLMWRQTRHFFKLYPERPKGTAKPKSGLLILLRDAFEAVFQRQAPSLPGILSTSQEVEEDLVHRIQADTVRLLIPSYRIGKRTRFLVWMVIGLEGFFTYGALSQSGASWEAVVPLLASLAVLLMSLIVAELANVPKLQQELRRQVRQYLADEAEQIQREVKAMQKGISNRQRLTALPDSYDDAQTSGVGMNGATRQAQAAQYAPYYENLPATAEDIDANHRGSNGRP